jgi:sulfur carrier protein
MKLVINGEPRIFDDVSSVADLIDKLGIKGDRVAVELNREIVPRAQWPASAVKDGDKLEIVHFVGGGKVTRPLHFVILRSAATKNPY